jgi:hypothetical protein
MAGRRRALGLALGALACAAIGSVAWLGAPRAPDHELALASPPSTECYSVAGGVDYHGTLNETRGGAACEAWPPSFAQFGYSGHNFCRAPPTIRTGCAWCFTNLAASAWACCKLPAAQPSCAREASEADVPHALVPGTLGPARPAVLISRAPPPPALSPPPAARALPTPASHEPAASGAHAPLSGARLAECFVRSDGSDYRGKVNTTAWGNTCQRWSAQTPHAHEFEPDRYPNDGLVANYCRRPGRRGPHCAWCYTVEETKHGYDCCDIGARRGRGGGGLRASACARPQARTHARARSRARLRARACSRARSRPPPSALRARVRCPRVRRPAAGAVHRPAGALAAALAAALDASGPVRPAAERCPRLFNSGRAR